MVLSKCTVKSVLIQTFFASTLKFTGTGRLGNSCYVERRVCALQRWCRYERAAPLCYLFPISVCFRNWMLVLLSASWGYCSTGST